MNFREFIWIFFILFVGFNRVSANEPEKKSILQSILGFIENILEIWQKWLNDKQIISNTTPLPIINSTTDPFAYNDFRLQDKTIPFNYNLTIRAYLSSNFKKEENYYTGHVVIKFDQESPSRMILFHIDPSLKILDQIFIASLSTGFTPKIIFSRLLNHQLYQIVFDQDIQKDKYLMEISFKGDYGSENNLVGFHKINFFENGQLKTMLATKFQPADARKAFPCFDEPAFKATFDITIEHPSDTIALGNWPQIINEDFSENGMTRSRKRFATTYKMSTYLAAWFIGPLDYISKTAISSKNITIKVWGTKTNIQNGYLDFALELAKKSLDFLENYYMNNSAPVPPKLDILSIPRTQSGASENWGLINLRENLILYSNKNTKLTQKQAISLTLAHEISHAWFGNYLTVRFWEDAWLKEAMSSFLAYKTVESIYPDFDQMRQYISTAKVPIMMEDSYSTTLPVAVKADNLTPDQILNMFTTITYDKGVSILIMLEKILGEDNFKISLREFIEKFRFGVANADLFYESIKLPFEFKEISTKSFVENWLYQKNFPELQVHLSYSKNRTWLNLYQRRFLFNPLNETDQEDFPSMYNNQWIIYLKCRVGGNMKSRQLSGDTREFSLVLSEKQGIYELDQEYLWVKCNTDFQGYFLINYDVENIQNLNQILAANYSAFSVEDRTEIVHEIFYFSLKGDKPYKLVKNISELIVKNENSFVTWSVFIWNLKKLVSLTEFRPSFKTLSEYLVPLLTHKNNVSEMFNDPEIHSISQIKSEILEILCRLESDECVLNAFEKFDLIPEEYFESPNLNSSLNILKQNQRAIVYKYAVKHSPTTKRWNLLWKLYVNSEIPSERENALNGLASSTRIWQLETLYEEAFKQDSKIRSEDFYPLMTLIGKSTVGRDFFWYKFQKDFNKIGFKFGFDVFLILTLKDVTENFQNDFMLKELTNSFPLSGTPFSLYVRHIRKYIIQNMYWLQNLENDLLNTIKV